MNKSDTVAPSKAPQPVISVGDRVKVTRPDPEYGIACILAGYKAAYLVVAVRDNVLKLETRITGMPDNTIIYAGEVTKVEDRPWWEKTGEAGT